MIVCSANNLSKSYGARPILKDVSFIVNQGERIGVVGGNGSGKTTLFRVLTGEEDADSGSAFFTRDLRLGYLRQENFREGAGDDGAGDPDRMAQGSATGDQDHMVWSGSGAAGDLDHIGWSGSGAAGDLDHIGRSGSGTAGDSGRMDKSDASSDLGDGKAVARQVADMGLGSEISEEAATGAGAPLTVLGVMKAAYAELTEQGIEVYESEVRGILRSMAFPDMMMDTPVSRLSGGEKTRLAFAELLLRKPDILMLDEPTNHLDIGTLNWLEQRLQNFPGTVLLISHDRYFLDRTVNKILEIEHGELTAYKGNYSVYAEKKRQLRAAAEKAWESEQQEIDRQERLIRSYKERGTEKLAKRAKSREKRLAHIERLEPVQRTAEKLKFHIDEKHKSGEDVLFAEGIGKTFGHGSEEKRLFRDVEFDIKRGERVCMVGANGIGKTTLMKIILGRAQPTEGFVSKGVGVRIGYYDQEQKLAGGERTVLDEMTSTYPAFGEGEMRNLLGRFLFRGDAVFALVDELSGGERARLLLLKLMLSGANTLLLDEPTNHLDIASMEAVEAALLDYPGAILAVSHDRYFLSRVPTRIVELAHEGLVNYPGNYEYYMEKKAATGSGKAYLKQLSGEDEAPEERALTESALERLRKKQEASEHRRRERILSELETKIHTLEDAIIATEAKIGQEEIYTDPEALSQCAAKLASLKSDLEQAYEHWYALM
jgi:ATP-binding cassette subfamily F protein 3